MSIFIPNRSIKLPKDISVPQSLSPSVFETHRRDQSFQMSKRFDGALVDVVSGVKSASVISGVRYGIVNGVVTEFGVNQPPIEDDGLRGCPAFTQSAKLSEAINNVVWDKIGLTASSDVSFQGKNVWKLTDSLDGSPQQHYIQQSSAFSGIADSSVIGLSFVAKAGEISKIGIAARLKSGSYSAYSRINISSGIIESSGGMLVSVIPLTNGFYSVSWFINSGSGAIVPRIFVTAQIDNNLQYVGSGDKGFLIGQPTYINFGVNGMPFVPPYVPNNTSSTISVVSETGSATNGTSFDLDNPLMARQKNILRGAGSQGHLELEIKTNFDSNTINNSTTVNVFTLNNNSLQGLYWRKDGSGNKYIRISDAANTTISLTDIAAIGKLYSIKIDWGTHPTGQKMRLTINGEQSSLADFSGWGTGDLVYSYENTVCVGRIKKDSLKIYDRPRW